MAAVKKEHKAYIGLALGTLIIGLSFVFVKIALRTANTSDLLAHRFSAAAIGMLMLYASGKVKLPQFTFRQMLSLLGLSLPYPLLFFTLQTEGLKFTPASEAGILSAMMPMLTVIAASLFLKEKSNFLQIISILLSVAGIVFILLKSGLEAGSNNLKGNLLILLSVVSIVIYYTLGRKINKNHNTLDITFFMTVTACIVFNLTAFFSHVQAGTINHFLEPLKKSSFLWSSNLFRRTFIISYLIFQQLRVNSYSGFASSYLQQSESDNYHFRRNIIPSGKIVCIPGLRWFAGACRCSGNVGFQREK